MNNSNPSRRRFLKTGATGVIVAVVAGVGGFLSLQQPQSSPPSPQQSSPRPAAPAPPVVPAVTPTLSPSPVASSLPPTPSPAVTPKPSPTLVEKAIQEGKLVIYHPLLAEEGERIAKAFQNKYPKIQFEAVRGGSELVERYLTEYRAGKHVMDVSINTPGFILQGFEEGLWAEYESPEAAVYPAQVKDPQKRWVHIFDGPVGIGYNNQLVKGADIPKTFWDILDPKFKNAVGTGHPNTYHYIYKGIEAAVGKDRFDEWLKGLNAQNPKIGRSGGENFTFLKIGEAKVHTMIYGSRALGALERGDPVDIVRGKGGLLSDPILILIYKYAPHPNAARLFTDWIISEEGQKYIASLKVYIPMRPGITSEIGVGLGSGVAMESKNILYYWPYTRKELEDMNAKVKKALGLP